MTVNITTPKGDLKVENPLNKSFHKKSKKSTNMSGYYGCLAIQCEHCGKTHHFSCREPLEEFVCYECKQTTKLSKLRQVYLTCECGNKIKYRTNKTESMFDLPCKKCGTPVAVFLNEKKGAYYSISSR